MLSAIPPYTPQWALVVCVDYLVLMDLTSSAFLRKEAISLNPRMSKSHLPCPNNYIAYF